MDSKIEARLEKVKRISRSARRACYWLMGLVSLATVAALGSLASPGSLVRDANGVLPPRAELSPEAKAFAALAFVGVAALALMVLYRLAQLFSNYSRGEIFTRGSVREIRLISYVAVTYVVFQTALFAATLAFFAGGTALPAGLRFDLPLGPALVATFLTLLAWVMDVGAELREETELTV